MSDQAPASPNDPAGRRLEAVRARIRRAAERAGRAPETIELVAVSKTFPAERILAMAGAGQRQFGENRIQEAREKVPAVNAAWSGDRLVWHWIGHLQRNKVKAAVGLFDGFESVDSVRLLGALSSEAEARERVLPVLLQFNCSGEATKGGFDPEAVGTVAAEAAAMTGVRIDGLMTIARPGPDPEIARPAFVRLREIRDRLQERWGRALPVLSMGMSRDLEVAVDEGATRVRVGTALFGERTPRT